MGARTLCSFKLPNLPHFTYEPKCPNEVFVYGPAEIGSPLHVYFVGLVNPHPWTFARVNRVINPIDRLSQRREVWIGGHLTTEI